MVSLIPNQIPRRHVVTLWTDPLFFLHHTQLDRLWWLWQNKDPENRMNAYGGHAQRHSIEMASLTDNIKMGALAPPIQVQEMMDIESDFLCYTYE
jgi:tyrosinase